MTASRLLSACWREAADDQVARVLGAARRSVTAFADATTQRGSLLQSWIQGREVVEFDHYPEDDVIDLTTGSQFYYHAHRHGDREHGHLHLFWHATASARRRHPKQGRVRWVRTAPSHLFAVSLDARGLPVALFAVNRWVTEGHWFNAPATMSCVEQFAMGEVTGHEMSCRWLTGFVHLYTPVIEHLLARRDHRLARRADQAGAMEDRGLEVLSHAALDWAADLDALEAEAARRGL